MPEGIKFKLDSTFSDLSLPILPYSLGVPDIAERYIAGSGLEASGKRVSSWAPAVGDTVLTVPNGLHGPDTSQAAAAGKYVDTLFFGGVSQALAAPRVANMPFTVAFLLYQTQYPAEQRVFIGGSGGSIFLNQWGFGATTGGTATAFGGKPTVPQWSVGVVSFNGANTAARVNGTYIEKSIGSATRSELVVGAGNSSQATPVGMNMFLRELVTWDRALTQAEMATVEADLRASIA